MSCRIVSRAGAALAASLALMLGAAHAASPELIEAARKEGQVVWYASFPQAGPVRAVAAAFERKYPGIRVRTAVNSPSGTVLKIQDEAKAGRVQADVSHGTSTIGPLKAAGLIDCYQPDNAKDYPDNLRDPDGCWVAQVLYFYGVAINTSLVPESDWPRKPDDLLDPRWKGKIAWAGQMSPAGAAGFIGAVMKGMGPEKGRDFLKRLSAQQIISVPANPRAVLDQVIAGQFPITLTSLNQHPLISAKQGAPVRWLAEAGISWGSLDGVFLVKGAPNRNAARLFIEFSLSEEGQAAFRDADSIPASPKVDASSPVLKPATGGFDPVLFGIADIDREIPGWIAIYDEMFK